MMAPTAASPRAPAQARSRATLERLLDATEALLRNRHFEDIEVDEIVRRARSSVGSFYARVGNKEALLPPLYARFDARLREELLTIAADKAWESRDLPATCRELAKLLVSRFREHAGLLRAVVLYARRRGRVLTPEQQAQRNAVMHIPVALLLRHRDLIADRSPERRAALAFFAANAAVREMVLFPNAPHAASLPMDDDALARFAAGLLFSYLTCAEVRI
jgi:AcrR family transcriptional regulator